MAIITTLDAANTKLLEIVAAEEKQVVARSIADYVKAEIELNKQGSAIIATVIARIRTEIFGTENQISNQVLFEIAEHMVATIRAEQKPKNRNAMTDDGEVICAF